MMRTMPTMSSASVAPASFTPEPAAAAAARGVSPTHQIHPAYRQMMRIAAELGWPACYQDDLVKIDRRILTGPTAPRSFVWQIRPTGTHLCSLSDGCAWQYASLLSTNANYLYGAEQRWYHAEGGHLTPIDAHRITEVYDRTWSRESVSADSISGGQVIDICDRTAYVEDVRGGHANLEFRVRFMLRSGMHDQSSPVPLVIRRGDSVMRRRVPA